MTEQTGNGDSGGWTASEYLLLALMMLLLALQYVLGYHAEESLQHLHQLTQRMAHAGAADGQRLITGGGSLYLWLHQSVLALGLPFSAYHGLYFLWDAAALLAWLLLARRGLPSPLVWCAALWLVTYGVPKQVVVENSTLVAFVSVPLWITSLLAARRRSLWLMLAVAALLSLCVHLSLISVFVLPALLVLVWSRRARGEASVRSRASFGLICTVMLVVAVSAAVLLQASGARTGGAIAEQRFRFQPELLGQTLIMSARFLLTYLWDPAFVLGGAALAICWRRRPLPLPHAGFCLWWLLLALLPNAVLDQFQEQYHFTMASPVRALVGGAGLAALLRLVSEKLDARLSWRTMLVAITSVLCLVAGIRAALTSTAGPLAEPLDHCSSWDGGCSPGRTPRLLAALTRAGLVPAEPRGDVLFHGVQKGCLSAARYWQRRQSGSLRSETKDVTEVLLLRKGRQLHPAPGLQPRHLTGAAEVQGLVAVPGVRSLRHDLRQVRAGPPPVFRLRIHGLGRHKAYVGLESSWNFSPGRVLSGASRPPLARCDHPHVQGYHKRYDGYLVVQGDGSEPFQLTIEDTDRHSRAPEQVTVLQLP